MRGTCLGQARSGLARGREANCRTNKQNKKRCVLYMHAFMYAFIFIFIYVYMRTYL